MFHHLGFAYLPFCSVCMQSLNDLKFGQSVLYLYLFEDQKYFGPRVYPMGSMVIALVSPLVRPSVRPSLNISETAH